MSKITEVAKGLKAAAYAVHNDEYIKGYNQACVATAVAILAGIAVTDIAATVVTYISNKQ